ncbi:MAG: rplQ [Bacteroidetes bacterium]|jgi:large subunit ribosomal protein L17|nr:rplQ [Bacteroidota bacterium]
MRHRVAGRKLKRTASHRRATLAALATALLRHKRITTTVAKAKETRLVVEKLITRARHARPADAAAAPGAATSERAKKFVDAAGHARREAGRLIKDREVIAELFSTIVEKVGTRPGGYTRIVKLGQRYGDGAEMAVIELVDFNTGKDQTPKKAEKPARKTTPKRKAAKKASAREHAAAAAAGVEPVVQNAGSR